MAAKHTIKALALTATHQFNLDPWGRKNDNSGKHVVGMFQDLGLVRWRNARESVLSSGNDAHL